MNKKKWNQTYPHCFSGGKNIFFYLVSEIEALQVKLTKDRFTGDKETIDLCMQCIYMWVKISDE